MHKNVALQINVTRHPYSFLGDSKSASGRRHETSTWHDGLLGYVGGDEKARDSAEAQLQHQGSEAGIKFNFNVNTHWQPVDSQRLLIWAGRFGLQEKFMTCLNERHFEQQTSASERPTLLAAAKEAGLDVDAATALLNTDELVDDVWESYGDTIHGRGIHSIPLFVFNVPQLGLVGGPFRRGGKGTPFVLNGSMDMPTFLKTFVSAYDLLLAAQKSHPLLGRRVALSGLSKAELNGRTGVVLGFNESSGRYEVAIDKGAAPLAIKPSNLEHADLVGDGTATVVAEATSSKREQSVAAAAAAPAAIGDDDVFGMF